MVCWVYVGMEGGVEWVQGLTATPVITQMGKHFLSLNNAITQKPLSFTLKEIKVILGLLRQDFHVDYEETAAKMIREKYTTAAVIFCPNWNHDDNDANHTMSV